MVLHTVLNNSYYELLEELVQSFNDDKDIMKTFVITRGIINTDADSPKICAKLSQGLDRAAIKKIFAKDETWVMLPISDVVVQHSGGDDCDAEVDDDEVSDDGEKADVLQPEGTRFEVGILKHTHARNVLTRMDESEKDAYWSMVHGILRFLSIINNTGSSLSVFEKVAATFISKNQDVSPAEYQTKLFSQLFSDKDLSSQLVGAFDSDDILTTMFGNLGGLLEGVGLIDDDDDDEDKDEEEDSEDDDVEDDTEKKDNNNLRQSEIGAMFARRRKSRKRVNRRKRRKAKAKNPLKDLTKLLSTIKLDESDMEDIRQGVKDTLNSGTKDGESSSLATMMSNLASANADGSPPDMQSMFNSVMASLKPPDNSGMTNEEMEKVNSVFGSLHAVLGNVQEMLPSTTTNLQQGDDNKSEDADDDVEKKQQEDEDDDAPPPSSTNTKVDDQEEEEQQPKKVEKKQEQEEDSSSSSFDDVDEVKEDPLSQSICMSP
jgi:FtsZ-interacting cell division protein YlmF